MILVDEILIEKGEDDAVLPGKRSCEAPTRPKCWLEAMACLRGNRWRYLANEPFLVALGVSLVNGGFLQVCPYDTRVKRETTLQEPKKSVISNS